LIFAKQLPADLQRHLFTLCLEGNLYEVAENILAFAGLNKENQTYINKNLITILEALPRTAKAIEVYKLLQNKTCSLPIMQMAHVKSWLKNAEKRLSDGQALYAATEDENPESIDALKKLLMIKTIDLNSKQTNKRDTCLCLAANKGHKEKVALLLEAGANPRIKGFNHNWGDYDDTPLVGVVCAENNADAEIAIMLINFGASPNVSFMKRTSIILIAPPDRIGAARIHLLISKAQELQKKRLEERKKRVRGLAVESKQSNTADGCVIS
jgi:ankyrin repeat protein